MRKYNKTAKQKNVVISIDGPLNLKEMINNGWRRVQVMRLFEQMQRIGLGEVVPGFKGKNGKCAQFIPNDTCPSTYEYSYVYYRQRLTSKEKEALNAAKEIDCKTI